MAKKVEINHIIMIKNEPPKMGYFINVCNKGTMNTKQEKKVNEFVNMLEKWILELNNNL